ncbi:MAG: DoxX family protein [Deltaproteobacteria bacterium]
MLPDKLVRHADLGLLIVRVGLGIMFMFHGAPKLFGGPEKWVPVGQAMSGFGITFAPAFWGFMCAFSEFVGGACVAMGLFFRLFAALLFIVMLVASRMLLGKGGGLLSASQPIEDGIVFLGLIFVGPGRFSLDAWLRRFFS